MKNLLCILSLLFFLSCNQSAVSSIGIPTIKAGTAKLTGRIINPDGAHQDSILLTIGVTHPISGEYVKQETLTDRSGKFAIDVDVETDITLISLYTSLRRKPLYVKLTIAGTTNIDITYNSNFEIKNLEVRPAGMSQTDMINSIAIMDEMLEYHGAPTTLYDKSTDVFLAYAKSAVSKRMEILNNSPLLSKEIKGILTKDFRLFQYSGFVFDYEKYMMMNYQNVTQDEFNKPAIKKIDKSYYRFLKDFKLNDPQYLNCYSFLEAQKKILQNEILDLPQIGETDIPSWLAKVKVILTDLVGFNDGPYYDILVANAYGRQLNEEIRPLSEKQKENIISYWKKGEIAKILLRKNRQVVELDKFKSPVVINDISSVPKEQVMEAILAKHKGKVVFIDLWATWCGPCLDAMTQFRNTKNEFHDKNVAFVYLTNGSSPRKLWEEKIKGIGSEHYYLTGDQWEYVMSKFEFEYIPSYLIYNKQGVFVNKFTAFPGNDELKKVINGVL
jgi:thiol-disulfide isomerase/thioredoxin